MPPSNKPALLHSIVGKRPWKVWKGVGSFLLFEFGARRKNSFGAIHGTYCLWIYMADWRITLKNREIAHSESPDKIINRTAEALAGRRLEAIVLSSVITKGEVHYAARFEFGDGYSLLASMYDNHEPSSIFTLYTPSAVISYDYDGAVVVKKRRLQAKIPRLA